MASRSFFASHKSLQLATAVRERGDISLHSARQPDQLLTTAQVRAHLGLPSLNAVYRMVRDYGLPRKRIGGVYRFSLRAVDAWIDAQNQSRIGA